MNRFSDWQTRLDEEFKKAAGRDFEWGIHDCCTFACNAVLAITGDDPASMPLPFRGTYQTKVGAYGNLNRLTDGKGLVGAVEMAAEYYGWEEIMPAFAQRGDLCLLQTEAEEGLGIVSLDGRNVMMANEPGGIKAVSRKMCSRAWRIG